MITLDSGAMYKENNAGPRDDPCGTPDSRDIMSDKNVPNLTTLLVLVVILVLGDVVIRFSKY